MSFTLISNVPLIVTPPLTQASPYYNPTFLPIDPINGNYFIASGRDLIMFYCSPVALAPAWNAVTTYTQGQVVNVLAGSPPAEVGAYIAIANVAANLNQNPTSSPTFWAAYTGSTVTIYSSPDACTGRKSDITNYPIPDGGHVQFEIEGSSFYTQASGQVQFIASSNLVTVLIESL
jgi:hypothetical protein